MKKKLCLLSYDLRSGGAERVISQWSTLLNDYFDVYMTTFKEQIMYPYSGHYVCLNVEDNYSNPINKVLNVIRRAESLRRFVEKENIDIVLSFCNECNLANTLSFHKAKKICSIRSASDIDTNFLVKYVIKSKRNSIIIQTEALREIILLRLGKKLVNKLYVYGNPFDVAKIREMSQCDVPENLKTILTKHKCLVHVGSFKSTKNHANLLKSFELVANKIDDVYLILIGANINLGNKIKDMAKQSRYYNRIIFVGETTNPFAIESKCSLFVFPSLAEGIPNALAEAMIIGIPVISTDCQTGPAELLSEHPIDIMYNNQGYYDADYGVLVKPFSGESDFSYNSITDENIRFATPIIKALTNETYYKELTNKAKRGATRFDIDEYKKGLVSLINDIAYGK